MPSSLSYWTSKVFIKSNMSNKTGFPSNNVPPWKPTLGIYRSQGGTSWRRFAKSLVPERAEAFLREIQLEPLADHPLHGSKLTAIARCVRTDDVLFRFDDGCVASVHLTWAQVTERPPWPQHQVYSNVDEWAQQVMLPTHEDW
jgi:hypothetical protein